MCQGLRPANLLKVRLWHRCLPVNFVKFLRTPLFTQKPQDYCFWRYEIFFQFFPFWKTNWHLKAATGNCSVKRCSEVCFCLVNWGVLNNAKSGYTDKMRCFVKILPFCVGCWRVLDYMGGHKRLQSAALIAKC